MDLIKEIHGYLVEEIALMNSLIIDILAVDEELIQLIGNHLGRAGGKRIRPILTILSAKMFGYEGKQAIRLATAVEFIHMATLLHDDVVDNSKMRRFLPTANVIWGNKESILVGDFLFSQSFKLIVSTKLIQALEALSSASAIIAQGEVAQLTQLQQKKILSPEECFKVIAAKTAELFGASCQVGAIIANRLDRAGYVKDFGLCLGKIFQITDDKLDYFSKSDTMGKNTGDDFYEGKVTLPLIFLAQKLNDDDKTKLEQMLHSIKRDKAEFEWVRDKMANNDILQQITDYLLKIKQEALIYLDKACDTDTKPKEYLKQLIDFAINREY